MCFVLISRINVYILCGEVGGSLKSMKQFKKSRATCKCWQGAKPKLKCGLANTSLVFESMFDFGFISLAKSSDESARTNIKHLWLYYKW